VLDGITAVTGDVVLPVLMILVTASFGNTPAESDSCTWYNPVKVPTEVKGTEMVSLRPEQKGP
jgi:hypothetical protein